MLPKLKEDLVLFTAVAIVVLGLFYYYGSAQIENETEKYISDTAKNIYAPRRINPPDIPAPAEKRWKTYRNDYFNYELTIPEDFEVNPNFVGQYPGAPDLPYPGVSSSVSVGGLSGFGPLQIEVLFNDQNFTATQWADGVLRGERKNENEIKAEQTFEINGRESYRATVKGGYKQHPQDEVGTGTSTLERWVVITFIKDGDRMIVMTYTSPETQYCDICSEYEAIALSFSFAD